MIGLYIWRGAGGPPSRVYRIRFCGLPSHVLRYQHRQSTMGGRACQWQGLPVSACCIRLCPSISRYGQFSVMQSTSIMSWVRGIFSSSGHGSPIGFLHIQFIVSAFYDDFRPGLTWAARAGPLSSFTKSGCSHPDVLL